LAFVMKLHTVLPLLIAVACSSSNNGAAPPTNDASDEAPAADAGSADAEDAAGSYAEAVLSATWKAVPGAPTVTGGAKQDDVVFPSASVGYAVSGPASTIYKTTNGGTTWKSVFTHTGTYFRSLLFIDESHGFASNLGPIAQSTITDTNVLYETMDGGTSWNPVTAITGPMPTGICNQTMIDPLHLVAVGRVEGPSFMMMSGDAGGTWTSTDLSSQLQMLIDARFTSPTDGIVVGGSAGSTMYCSILHTTNGGGTWQPVFQSATPSSLCWKISFPSSLVGYVSVQDTAGGTSSFAKTIDGGLSWKETPLENAGTGYAGIGMGFITEDIGWISADDVSAPTLRTTDGGQTWAKDSALVSPINRFRFLSPTTAFAIGATIWRLDVPWTGGEP
jgi:photosystem II stability/assembly factor-like uncharacterized protein